MTIKSFNNAKRQTVCRKCKICIIIDYIISLDLGLDIVQSIDISLILTIYAVYFSFLWRVKGDIADDTLFNPNGTIKKTEYFGQQYCTCVSPDNNYPHGSPEFNCNLTALMETCQGSKTADGVFTAPCSSRFKWSVNQSEQEDDEPPSYPMILDDSPSEIVRKITIVCNITKYMKLNEIRSKIKYLII